ncbi:MAG: ATP-binding protein [Gammaproteobacteria bacterium]|nr:ATP-binding protein [Gammaproteobacteria bacterium]
MTREEIEEALLTGSTIYIDSKVGDSIELNALHGRRLVEVVFDHLQSSTVDTLVKNTKFFDALEAAFRESPNEMEPQPVGMGDVEEAKKDSRSWRLKKVETRGFGGLNAAPNDIFEFDVASRDSCIEGQNGCGKSSLANAVLFAMTGRIHRDQYGILDKPTRQEPVMSDEGGKLGDWPPIAAYPGSWGSDRAPVDVSVRLTFGNESDEEEAEARRRLYGDPGALEEEVSIDSRLTTVPTLIETGLLMPMRIQHIRMPKSDDNDQLVGLIRQLIGLDPLLDVASLVDRLCHRSQRFLKYASDNDSDKKRKDTNELLEKAQEKIKELDTGLDLTVDIKVNSPVPDERLKDLCDAKEDLIRKQAEGFQALADLAFEGFDPDQAKHRQSVVDTVNRLHLDAVRWNEPINLPANLKGITTLSERVGEQDFEILKSTLEVARSDLADAVKWSVLQKEDTLLRLKAVAAIHFKDRDDPLCPLCEQSLKNAKHQSLVEDLRTLKLEAEAAQTRLADACRRIEGNVRQASRNVIPDQFMQVKCFAIKQNIQDEVLSNFVKAPHIAQSLPGFAEIAQNTLDMAFTDIKEVEFGSNLSEPANDEDEARVTRFLDHLNSTIQAAENWQQSLQIFRDGWARLFSKKEDQSLTTRILQLKGVIDGVEPFRSASNKVEQALAIADKYNAIVKRQALREEIADAIKPLRKLRSLVNLTTRQTIDDVSGMVKIIHQQIYNPEALSYQKAEVSEFRGRQSLSFQAKLGSNLNWRIDASLLANVSWMRGILWSFVFAIRDRAIKELGHCPFELIVLDDPQITFDSRNLKGWAQFLSSSDGLRKRQSCQLLVTTHSMPFALEMTAMHEIRMLAMEAGHPWSQPAQIVEGDFAKVRFDKMIAENSDDRARSMIGDIRVLAETLLKHSIQSFDPIFVRQPEATLGRMIEWIANRNASKQPPYGDKIFGELVAVKSSYPCKFSQLSEPHHSVSETITVREAKQAYEFWRETLFPAIRKIWEEYRFLQKSIIGESAAIHLPANCNHTPSRSVVLAAVQPEILGRVSAYSDGRAASAIRIYPQNNGGTVNLSARAAYRLEKDTLSPVARVGDILLTRLDGQCRAPNLVIEDRGTHRVARRWLEYKATPALAVLAASSSNPREVPPAVISRAKGANRHKIIGVLFAADQLQPGDRIGPDTEVTCLAADNRMVANLIANTDVFEVQGSSAEPIALDQQYLLAKSARDDLAKALYELDGKPVIAEDSEDCAFFKRLRVLDAKSVILESLDKTGAEEMVRLSTDPEQPGPMLLRVREVVGVVFDKM